MRWVEVKMRELGVSTHPSYKLLCMLDHMAMVTVKHEKYGECGRGPCMLLSAICVPAGGLPGLSVAPGVGAGAGVGAGVGVGVGQPGGSRGSPSLGVEGGRKRVHGRASCMEHAAHGAAA